MLIRSLILSASIAALAAFSNAAPTPSVTAYVSPAVSAEATPTASAVPAPTTDPSPTSPPSTTPGQEDPCTILSGLDSNLVTYNNVAACYNAIPFNNIQAAATLKTVHGIFQDYYIFTDSALSPHATPPFASERVDILGELEKIARHKYSSDHLFHEDIRRAVVALRDGHASYDVSCYQAYAFMQNLTLYAPVIDGKQSIRILKDKENRGYNDCTVTTINGEDAFSHLYSFAEREVYTSHDANVRLNFALGSQDYIPSIKGYLEIAGDFARRAFLPDVEYVEYELQCPNANEPVVLREPWNVLTVNEATFTDIDSFVANVCLDTPVEEPAPVEPTPDEPTPGETDPVEPTSRALATSSILDRRHLDILDYQRRADPEPTPEQQLEGATKLVEGNATIFYQLHATPDVGVLVCHTFSAEDSEQEVIFNGLTAFHGRNVSKIIIDFQGNGGGQISLMSFLVQMFFPNKEPFDALFESDFRLSKFVQENAHLGLDNAAAGFFNAKAFHNLANGTAPYENNDIFENPVSISRNGRRNQYSRHTSLFFEPFPTNFINGVADFPWTGKADSLRLLTDGRCGSACGMASYFLTDRHGVDAYAIGGTSGKDLSMFSFAGAGVIEFSALQSFYKGMKVTSPLEDLAYKSTIRYSWHETYAKGRTTPFEYDAELYKSKHRLNYTPENAHSRGVLWKEVVAAAWN